jgi:hypothetical protein
MIVECASPLLQGFQPPLQEATPFMTRLDENGRRTLPSSAVTMFHTQGFLSVTNLTCVSEVAHVQRIIDGLYRQKGKDCGFLRNPSALAPELRHTSIYASCQAIAQQLLGRHTWSSCDLALYKDRVVALGPRGTRTLPSTVNTRRITPLFSGFPSRTSLRTMAACISFGCDRSKHCCPIGHFIRTTTAR